MSETGRHGHFFCFFSKQNQSLNTVPIKTSLCSIHDTIVFWNNIGIITYSCGAEKTSVHFWSPYFFSRIPFSSYTDMSECRPCRWFFFSASSLLIISVFIHRQKWKLKSNLIDSYSFLFKAELLDQTAEVWCLKLFSFLPWKFLLLDWELLISRRRLFRFFLSLCS